MILIYLGAYSISESMLVSNWVMLRPFSGGSTSMEKVFFPFDACKVGVFMSIVAFVESCMQI